MTMLLIVASDQTRRADAAPMLSRPSADMTFQPYYVEPIKSSHVHFSPVEQGHGRTTGGRAASPTGDVVTPEQQREAMRQAAERRLQQAVKEPQKEERNQNQSSPRFQILPHHHHNHHRHQTSTPQQAETRVTPLFKPERQGCFNWPWCRRQKNPVTEFRAAHEHRHREDPRRLAVLAAENRLYAPVTV